MTLRYDDLSKLIYFYNTSLDFVSSKYSEIDDLITQIQSHPDYATQTSAETKTILSDTHDAIASANSAMLDIPSE